MHNKKLFMGGVWIFSETTQYRIIFHKCSCFLMQIIQSSFGKGKGKVKVIYFTSRTRGVVAQVS